MPIRSRHIKPGPAACVQGGGRPVRCLAGMFLLVLSLLVSSQASAGTAGFNSGSRQVTLLALYTSQGCSG